MLYVLKYAFKESLWITTETSVAYLTTELTIRGKRHLGSRIAASINPKYVNNNLYADLYWFLPVGVNF